MSLLADLLRPEAYGSLQPARVDLVETHISWVFLADDRVFKVKKPVDLGFLDFRTVEQRRTACEAEVQLNTRLAPDVYRGIAPVRRDAAGHFSLGEDGEIVDWAVAMARLPDERRADLLLARGELSGRAVEAIAERIAGFHRWARFDGATARLGAPDVLQRNIDENFAQVRGWVDRCVGADPSEDIARWQTAFVRGHEDLFARRIAGGRVREGHGDLRLEHVYLLPSAAPTIVDCIEFNERFRVADVCADVAFLSMDLAAHGRVDLAERLLARYARESNDFDLYSVVDFYESYRAYVRGKIAAIVASDRGFTFEARRRAEREARRYFLLALAAERRSMLLPVVVAVGGVIATGKSTIADRLGDQLSAPVISADRSRKAMRGVGPTHPLEESAWTGAYDEAVTESVYAEILRQAEVVLGSGRPVVVDASFRSRALRRTGQELANRHHVPFRFVECRADAAVCRARLETRAKERGVSDGRIEIFDAFCARYEPVTELPPDDHVVLDTRRTIDDSLATLRARMDTWPAGFVT